MAIGVFDSGVGGLTVHRELTRRFPDRDFVYLADQANAPYGSNFPKSPIHDLRFTTLIHRGYIEMSMK